MLLVLSIFLAQPGALIDVGAEPIEIRNVFPADPEDDQ